MSSSGADALPLPIAALQYRDIALPSGRDAQEEHAEFGSPHAGKRRGHAEFSEADLEARIHAERSAAVMQVEQQLREEYEQKIKVARMEIASALEAFAAQRADYFARVEAEAVQLSLSVAAKILRREAQVDPMLVAALVRMTMEKMREGSSVTVRVSPGNGAEWKRYFAARPSVLHVEVLEDSGVDGDDCVLETELGSAHFGLEAQLKEVERGFFDLLALRPVTQ